MTKSLLFHLSQAALLFPSLVAIYGAACAMGAERRELDLDQITLDLRAEGEIHSMVVSLERSLAAGDVDPFNAILNADWLLERAMAAVVIDEPDLQKAFCDGTHQSWKNRGLAADYLGTHFRFLRAHCLGGRAGLLFRAGGKGGALNYCLLTLARSEAGKCAIDDVYVVGLNEFVSDTLRRGFMTLLDSLEPKSEAGRRATVYLEHLPTILQVSNALRQKDFALVLELSRGLPEALRNERGVLLMRLEASEHVSAPERVKILAEWRSQYPDEMSLPLKFADFHIAQGRMGDAERVLRALDQKLGGDSYLKLRVGEVRMLQRHADQLAAARKAAPPLPVAGTPTTSN